MSTEKEVKEHRLLGPPGTGKTTELAKRVRSAVERRGRERVLVMSFTKAAAVEITGRALGIPNEQIGTMHAICYRALGHPKLAVDTVPDFNKQHPEFAIIGDLDMDDPGIEEAWAMPGTALMVKLDGLRARMIPRDHWTVDVTKFAAVWDSWKAFTGTVDFSDLIEICLRDHDMAPGDPSVIFMDEVQDSTAVELALLRKWGRNADWLVIAGDDDQAIYNFRGATPDAFMQPELSQERITVLPQSHRLPLPVWQYAERWVQQIVGRFPKKYSPKEGDGAVVRLPVSYNCPDEIIKHAMCDVEQGKSVMVLTTCRYMLFPLVAELRRLGIPFHNPYRTKSGDWNPLGPRTGVSTVDRLLAFMRPSSEAWGVEARGWTWSEVKMWSDLLSKDVLGVGTKVKIREAMEKAGEEAMASVGWLSVLLPHDTLRQALVGNLPWFAENLVEGKRSVTTYPLAAIGKVGVDGVRQHVTEVQGKRGTGLMVGTIHSIKGGEADVVYLFPDLSTAGYDEYKLGAMRRNNVLRQIYVGITRAKYTLNLCRERGGLTVNWI